MAGQKTDIGEIASKFSMRVEQTGFDKIKSELQSAEASLGRISGSLLDAVGNGARDAAAGFQQINANIGGAINAVASLTAGIRGQLISAQNEYTQSIGASEAAARKLLDIHNKIVAAQNQMGRVQAQAAAPIEAQNAAFQQMLANVVQQNPIIAQLGSVVTAAQQGSQGPLGGIGGLATGAAAFGAEFQGQGGILGGIADAIEGGIHKAVQFGTGLAAKVGINVPAGGGAAPALENQPYFKQAEDITRDHNRQIEDFERQLGQQRVQIAMQHGQQLVQFFTQQARQREDFERSSGRQLQDQSIQQGREFARAGLQNERTNRDALLNQIFQRGQAEVSLVRQQGLELLDLKRQQVRQAYDFEKQQTREQAALDYQQHIETVQFNIQQANAAHQFQVQEQRNAEDHQFRLLDLAAARDALGIYKENRQFNVQKQRDQQDFDYQRGLAAQQRQIQITDQRYQFDLQRKYQLEDYKLQQARQLEDIKWRQEREKEDLKFRQVQEDEALKHERQMQAVHLQDLSDDQQIAANQLREDVARQRERLDQDQLLAQQREGEDIQREIDNQHNQALLSEQQFRENLGVQLDRQLGDLLLATTGLQTQWSNYYDFLRNQASVFIGYIQAQGNGADALAAYVMSLTNAERAMLGLPPASGGGEAPPSNRRAGGGYMGEGIYSVGEGGEEFVLSNRATRAAEAAIGGRLSQDKMLAAMGGGSMGGGITLQQNFSFQGSFTEGDKQWFRQAARDEAVSALTTAVRNVAAARKR